MMINKKMTLYIFLVLTYFRFMGIINMRITVAIKQFVL